MEAAFAQPSTDVERKVREAIESFGASEVVKLEQLVSEQRKGLADAQRSFVKKQTKATANSERIATDKVAWAMGKLSDLKRVELVAEDSRVFPGWYAPVMVMENGRA